METKSITKAGVIYALFFIASNIIPPLNIMGIPFTCQTLVIFLIPFIFNLKEILIWYCGLIVICLIGIPIMSNFQGGLSVLVGPSAGFIYGWLVKLFVIKLGLTYTKKRILIFLIMLLGSSLALFCGATWLSSYNNVDTLSNFKVILVSFLPVEIVKIIITLVIIRKIPSSLI